MDTFHAPAERRSLLALKESISAFQSNTITQSLLNAHAGIGMILNEQRQIIAVNSALLEVLHLDCYSILYGLRPGEALNCVYATKNEGGCGTDIACRNCGAVRAILASYKKKTSVVDTCFMRYGTDENNIRDAKFEVVASPIMFSGEQFTIVFFRDISEEEKQKDLEKFFYHDIKNILGALLGYVDLVKFKSQDQEHYIDEIGKISQRLNDEIEMQRTLKYAKEDIYAISLHNINIREIVEECSGYVAGAFSAQRHRFSTVIAPECLGMTIVSDKSLLLRILTNMMKNAFEYPVKDGKITLAIYQEAESFFFFVENEGEIPEDIQLRIFQEYFTTKEGFAHGVGTFSMKLFGEKLLHGKVSFLSENNHTKFIFEHPMLTARS